MRASTGVLAQHGGRVGGRMGGRGVRFGHRGAGGDGREGLGGGQQSSRDAYSSGIQRTRRVYTLESGASALALLCGRLACSYVSEVGRAGGMRACVLIRSSGFIGVRVRIQWQNLNAPL
eukprot:4080720-Pleurochrysis_carterae.AAC.1